MLHTAHRPLPAPMKARSTTALLALALAPGLAMAEVSDKTPALWHIWAVALGASAVCMAGMAWRRWLGAALAVVPALWFAGLLLEIHSTDVGPYLYAEQGWSYYLQAYLALAVFLASLVLGLRLGERRRRASGAAAGAQSRT